MTAVSGSRSDGDTGVAKKLKDSMQLPRSQQKKVHVWSLTCSAYRVTANYKLKLLMPLVHVGTNLKLTVA
jgi:hypothetical protein